LNLSIRESAIRRSLKKQGYLLHETPTRSKEQDWYGVGYMVVDATNTVVLGATHHAYDGTLDEVETYAAAA
jgi:hypothetical protein